MCDDTLLKRISRIGKRYAKWEQNVPRVQRRLIAANPAKPSVATLELSII
jgi:hypothetical protein